MTAGCTAGLFVSMDNVVPSARYTKPACVIIANARLTRVDMHRTQFNTSADTERERERERDRQTDSYAIERENRQRISMTFSESTTFGTMKIIYNYAVFPAENKT